MATNQEVWWCPVLLNILDHHPYVYCPCHGQSPIRVLEWEVRISSKGGVNLRGGGHCHAPVSRRSISESELPPSPRRKEPSSSGVASSRPYALVITHAHSLLGGANICRTCACVRLGLSAFSQPLR
eukprot:4950319-Pyramimonas_sp.AAC.2